MGISLKVVLHTKQYQDGTHPVMLQCIVAAAAVKDFKRRTLCRVLPHQFDKANGRVKNHPNQQLLNLQISKAFNLAEERLLTWQLQGKPIEATAVVALENSPVYLRPMFLDYGHQYLERCRLKGLTNTVEKYGGHLVRLAEYLGKTAEGKQKDIALDEVTEEWLLRWTVWLRENGSKSVNTIHRRMAFVKTLFIDATKRGLTKNDPMALLTFREQRVRKSKLSLEQISTLERVELTGRLNDARNVFLLQFYTYGTRISDALNWRKENVIKQGDIWHLEYTSMKTGQLMSIQLNAKAKVIIAQYEATVEGPFLLPWLAQFRYMAHLTTQQNESRLVHQIGSKTQMVNIALKPVAIKAGIALNLTTHIARHSFANFADSRIADKRQISAALGHTKFATTEIYLSELSQSQVNDAMAGLWL